MEKDVNCESENGVLLGGGFASLSPSLSPSAQEVANLVFPEVSSGSALIYSWHALSQLVVFVGF